MDLNRMRVGVISDSHDRLPAIDAALSLFARRNVDAVIHTGDYVAPFAARRLMRYRGPLHAIFGNNDGEREGLQKIIPQMVHGPLSLQLGGRVILVHHFIEWCSGADIEDADVIVTGHTHETVNRVEGGKLFLNAGECCGWTTGRCTVAVLDTDSLSAEIHELELER